MPLESSLNVSPYFDDYDQAKEFYRVLFKPGVAVQTRELNQLQTIIQNQIERFGDHVFKSGTIVSGVNFSYFPNYSYIKILDAQGDGQPSLPSSYQNYFVKSNLNLTARVVNYEDGLESKSPDLKTLYLQYITSSNTDVSNGNAVYTQFAPGQQLTVFSQDYPIFKVIVNNGGLGFSNSDTVVIESALTISGNTVAFTNGEIITQATTNATATVTSINTTAIANTIVLQIKPRTVDMTNTSVNSAAWTFNTGYNITGATSGATANVVTLIGSDAQAIATTDTLGIVQTVTITSGGSDYVFLPKVSIKTTNASATVNNLDLLPQNYKATVTVGNSSINSVATGYAFSVSEGIIYQKGYFLKVDPQTIIVDKFTTTPNNVAIGFKTVETTVNANQDESLYDNAANTTNYAAPGADRLNLTPVLVKQTIDGAAANVDFFALAEWKEGYPYKENRTTVYGNLGAEFARRTRESQGDFVVDPFTVSTKEYSTPNTSYIQSVIDPGTSYISGYRVQTSYNNVLDIERSTTTTSIANQTVSINFGNYIKVKEVAGLFNFKAGASISLYDTAKTFITSGTLASSGTITPAGNAVGTARIRSWTVDSGIPGTASCVYKLYLFDVAMNQGRSFRDVRSVFYDGAVQDGIADVVLTYDATSGANVALITDVNANKMVFNLGKRAVANVTNVTYVIRTNSDATLQLNPTYGSIQIGPLGTGETFPYSDGALASTQKKDFIVFPVANAVASANIAGGITLYANTTVSGSSTTFASDVQPGDFLSFANATATVVRQVATVANNTTLTLTTSGVVMTANAALFYPALYPLALENRTDRSVTVSSSGTTAVINIGKVLSAAANVVVVYNKKISSASPVTKTVNRDLYVKIHTSNNAATNQGPWTLGIPGPIRLKNVYLGSDIAVNTNSTDVTKYFFLDTGEDENAYRTSKLVLQSGAPAAVNTNQYILVKLDAFTAVQEGFFSFGSYSINDTANLTSSTSTINTLELPEMVSTIGEYYDARDTIDFRPYGANTANLATTVAGASINPASTFTLSGADQLWPAPDSTLTFDSSYYNERTDRITLNKEGVFKVLKGSPGIANTKPVAKQSEEVGLALIKVPPYPSIPLVMNSQSLTFAIKRTGNARGEVSQRARDYVVYTSNERGTNDQPKRFTMADIGKLERRIDNIEYVTSLTQVEAQIKDKVIPSGITPTTSRFKHGFFVEPFVDQSHSDLTHREYQATIDVELGLLKPPTKQINFESRFNRDDATTANSIINTSTLMLPYTHESLIDQSIKSALVSSAGDRVQFIGEGLITPPTFSIKLRGQIDYVEDRSTYTAPGGGSCGGGGCFTADSIIELADGTTKPINEICIGDIVKNFDGTSTNKVVFVETALGEWFPSLYTPSKQHKPFATINHPLYIENKLQGPDPTLYKWLDVALLEFYAQGPVNDQYVYNLWTDGDSTYRVNGYGTTSIVGDGGLMRVAYEQGLITTHQAAELINELTTVDPVQTHGIYLLNRWLGKVNIKQVNRLMAYMAIADATTIRKKILIGSARLIGHIATLVTGK